MEKRQQQFDAQCRASSRVQRGLFNGAAILGCVTAVSKLWALLAGIPQIKHFSGLTSPSYQSNDVFADTDYPLRPAFEPWDIATSYSFPRTFNKTVSEGTWLRITAHPTKDEIVFDMLGDLYCQSTTEPNSGTAYPFLIGVPFDKEAEFSADGSAIVFISDAGFGVDNIWTLNYTTCEDMVARASQLRTLAIQQTNSTFRFFSSPAFHPTEPKLIATKWFLTGRPNGAGEIWEFPLLSKSATNLPERGGQRVIARELPPSWTPSQYPESQLGAEQARYTNGGDGIIFTRNVRDRDSGKFSYNKDVHAGINAIVLLNTTTGTTTELVAATAGGPNKPASPGGANMPRLSRDGRTLAFVRRMDDKSVLVLKDMRSGTVHYAWDGLTYDVSMITAFMGAYPNYGWAANDTAIIIWSQGQIYIVSMAQNEFGERIGESSRKLAFKANISLDLATTRYSEVNVQAIETATETILHAFNGLRLNSQGTLAIFEGAGDNYIMDFKSTTTVPLLKPDGDISCYSPSFIHETNYTLQACWDDQSLTQFYVVDPRSNHISKVKGVPRGKYVSPVAFREHIAFVRTGKDYMLGDVEETFGEGIWIGRLLYSGSSILATELRLIKALPSSAETKLEFVRSGERTELLVLNPKSATAYDLATGASTTIATGKTSVEMVTSSQSHGRSIAFRDFQHIWLSSLTEEQSYGLWSKPGDKNRPSNLVRLSADGGHDVAFSGDGRIVGWLFGPTLYIANINDVEKLCGGAPLSSRDTSACAGSAVNAIDIKVVYKTALAAQIEASAGQALVLTNASLISMATVTDRLISNATIVIRNGTIDKVGRGSDVSIPKKAKTYNLNGGAVLPGFIDVHGHWGGFLTPYPLTSWEMATFLGYGVTTIHNPSSKNVAGMAERARIEKGRMYGPRVYHTGDVLYGSTQPNVYTEINSLADARSALLRVKVEGGNACFSVKNYQLAARSARQRLLQEAKEVNMLVVPEGGWSLDWDLTYFIDGFTSLEHPLPIPELYDDVLSLVAASGSSYTPLAVMNYGGIFGQHWVHQSVEIPKDSKLRKYVRHDILESLTEVKQAPKSSYQFFNTTLSTGKLAERGVRTNVGAHGEQPIGYLYHSEMEMMSFGGQDYYQILRAATIGGATSLGLNASLGTVEAGKLADLVVYPPGVDSVEKVWEAKRDIKWVISRGTVLDVSEGLREVWPREGRTRTMARLNAEDN